MCSLFVPSWDAENTSWDCITKHNASPLDIAKSTRTSGRQIKWRRRFCSREGQYQSYSQSGVFTFCVMFYSFVFLGVPPPSSQINHTQRFVLSSECPALPGLVLASFSYLKLSWLPFASGLFPSLTSVVLPSSYSVTDWVAALTSSFPCSHCSFLCMYSLLPASPSPSLLLPRYSCLFFRPSAVLDRQRITASQS